MESESDPLTRRAVDLFEKEPLKGNSEVHLHTPTKFGEDRSKDLGGDREQTDRQTNRQTDKRCSIYSMISPGCPRPNSALMVQKSGLKHRSSIHPSADRPHPHPFYFRQLFYSRLTILVLLKWDAHSHRTLSINYVI